MLLGRSVSCYFVVWLCIFVLRWKRLLGLLGLIAWVGLCVVFCLDLHILAVCGWWFVWVCCCLFCVACFSVCVYCLIVLWAWRWVLYFIWFDCVNGCCGGFIWLTSVRCCVYVILLFVLGCLFVLDVVYCFVLIWIIFCLVGRLHCDV